MVANENNNRFNLASEDFSKEGFCESQCELYNACHGEREACLKRDFADLLSTLTETEEAALKLRFGLCGNKPHTCAEIASRLGIEEIEVRRITAKAIRKLRHPSRRRVILNKKSYYLSSGAVSYKNLIAEVFGEDA